MATFLRPTRHITIAAAVFSLSLVPLIAQSGSAGPGRQGPPSGPPPEGRGQAGPPPGDGSLALERLGRELSFTDAQKTEIQALLTAQRTALKSALDSLRQARKALDTAVMHIPEDDGLLQAQVNEMSALETQIVLARTQTEAKIFQLLTPDQRQKVQAWLAERDQRRPGPGRGRSGR